MFSLNLHKGSRLLHYSLIALLLAIVSEATSAPETEEAYRLGLDNGGSIKELELPAGKSQIIETTQTLSQVVVGNPEVANVEVLGDTQFLVLGRSPGITNVAFRNDQDEIIALLDVVVGYDMAAIKRQLHEIVPEEDNIEVRSSNGKVLLSGQVSNSSVMDRVLAVTRNFAGDDVVNLMQVGGGHQVLLEARIAEVKRNALRDLGVQTDIAGTAGSETAFTLLSGDPLQEAFGPGLFVNNTSVANPLEIRLQALEESGSAKVLAEPNLVAMSGREASFLVGGEFPVPVVQAGTNAGSITIQFKEFGVGLRFTPTVLSNQRINLRLHTEVSDLDTASGTSVLGTTVPGIRTRRAATTIELGDGKSFAIAGLLQNDITTVVKKFPALGEVPILGALFRSSDFAREETELVIMVTPRLVSSVDGEQIELPTDDYRPPSEWDQYFMGRTEAPSPDAAGNPSGSVVQASGEAQGLDGAQGHQF